MKKIAVFLFTICLASAAFAQATASTVAKKDLSPDEISRIIKGFTRNESRFRQALNAYAFNRSATIQTIGLGGNITGVFRRDSYMTFNEAGDRFESVLFAPLSTMTEIEITAADLENLGGIDPFAIEPKVVDQYSFNFVGVEHIDDFNLYVFDVAPKVMPDAKKGVAKFFQGRVWVDVDDLMIVRTRGKAVPEGKERFPIMETTRGSVDNKYYFPIDTRADDSLVFPNGQVVKIRVRIKYTNYRVGRSEVRILDDDTPPTPTPTPAPKPPVD